MTTSIQYLLLNGSVDDMVEVVEASLAMANSQPVTDRRLDIVGGLGNRLMS